MLICNNEYLKNILRFEMLIIQNGFWISSLNFTHFQKIYLWHWCDWRFHFIFRSFFDHFNFFKLNGCFLDYFLASLSELINNWKNDILLMAQREHSWPGYAYAILLLCANIKHEICVDILYLLSVDCYNLKSYV